MIPNSRATQCWSRTIGKAHSPLNFSVIFALAGAAMLMFFIKVGFDH
jgi:hypothetical protein